ncbi:MAG: glycosyltransferase family 4 protein [Desulfobulbaceae bacterium]|nr:glycosyltransferase family 4 protein [Desulfobulbaceae bacterium]
MIFAHLLNDYSGSPKVLRETISAVCIHKIPAKLYVSSSGEGFLSTCGISTSHYWYKRTGKRALTLITYFASQLFLFFQLLFDKSIARNAVVYINTLLPFGAALYGKVTGRKVIYHVHEISVTPAPLKYLLTEIAQRTSSLNIYVSDAHRKSLPLSGPPSQRIYNALDNDFLYNAMTSNYKQRHNGIFTVLMITSLRDYKGVIEFLNLATSTGELKEIIFELVVNDDSATINRYFAGKQLPANLTVYPRTTDTALFYCNASLVLNLSRVDQCVETFGLTILEAMAFGIPVIVPPVGGPSELVVDGKQGFLVDSRDSNKLRRRVLELSADPELCQRMSKAGRERAAEFSTEAFSEAITAAIYPVMRGME